MISCKNFTLFWKHNIKFKSCKISRVSKQAIKKQSVCNEWLFTQAWKVMYVMLQLFCFCLAKERAIVMYLNFAKFFVSRILQLFVTFQRKISRAFDKKLGFKSIALFWSNYKLIKVMESYGRPGFQIMVHMYI